MNLPQDGSEKMIINPFVSGELKDRYEIVKDFYKMVYGNDVPKEADVHLRFASLCFDPNSTLVRQYPDLKDRRRKAAEMLHIKEGPSPLFIVAYLKKIIKSRLWTLICSNERTFDEYAEKVNMPIMNTNDDNDMLKTVELKNKLLTQMDDMRSRISALYAEMFDHDEELIAASEQVEFTPESIARSVKKK
jgi:hypothetical protein